MDTNTHDAGERISGLSGKQWAMLFLAFVLGIACVFTLDKTVMARGAGGSNTVQAATASP